MMKLCINCYTENPVDEVFCSECGMSLMQAPTGQEAMKLKAQFEAKAGLGRTWKDRTQPELSLTASGLLYLFGEQFVEPGSGRFVGGQALLVYSGHKVALQRLRERLVLMALLSLAEDGYISLREDNRWSLRIFRIEIRSTEATITREKEAGELPPSLERAIMDALSGDPEGNRVRDVVARAERECGGVVSCVMSALAEAGYLDWVPEAGLISGYTVRWCADEEAVAPLAGEVVILKGTLEAFRRANPRLYHLLLGEIHDVYKSSW